MDAGAPVSDLRNLGPKSREWLAAIGIRSVEDLRRAGAVPAYVALKRSRAGVSLNALYALVGALEDAHWLEVKRERRLELVMQVEDYEQRHPLESTARPAP